MSARFFYPKKVFFQINLKTFEIGRKSQNELLTIGNTYLIHIGNNYLDLIDTTPCKHFKGDKQLNEIFILSKNVLRLVGGANPRPEPRTQPKTQSLKCSTQNPIQNPGFWVWNPNFGPKKTEKTQPDADPCLKLPFTLTTARFLFVHQLSTLKKVTIVF